jgi:D-amino peptidase
MKVYILIDAEGVSGVVSQELQAKPGAPEYERMRTYFMSDLNAAVEGAHRAGAGEIVVYDMHYFGLNALLEELHPEARLVMGKPPKTTARAGIDESFDAFIMIGFHAMAETGGGVLPHTYDLSMKSLRLNGILMGEIGMEAAMAGTCNVPVVMVSGDEEALNEATELLGDIETACVKYGVGANRAGSGADSGKKGDQAGQEWFCPTTQTALCLPLSKTKTIIQRKVMGALGRIGDFKPYTVRAPYTVEIEFFEEASAMKAASLAGVVKKGPRLVELAGRDLIALWERFICEYQKR